MIFFPLKFIILKNLFAFFYAFVGTDQMDPVTHRDTHTHMYHVNTRGPANGVKRFDIHFYFLIWSSCYQHRQPYSNLPNPNGNNKTRRAREKMRKNKTENGMNFWVEFDRPEMIEQTRWIFHIFSRHSIDCNRWPSRNIHSHCTSSNEMEKWFDPIPIPIPNRKFSQKKRPSNGNYTVPNKSRFQSFLRFMNENWNFFDVTFIRVRFIAHNIYYFIHTDRLIHISLYWLIWLSANDFFFATQRMRLVW